MPTLSSNYAYDLQRFLKYSAVNRKFDSQIKLRAKITMYYHKIEKGLALKNPKVNFGGYVIQELLSDLVAYDTNYGLDETGQIAINTLFAYHRFNSQHEVDDEKLYQAISKLRNSTDNPDSYINQGGVLKVTKQGILNAAKVDLRAFFESRHSIRQFTSEEVDIKLIQKAVAMAQKTPSVCNRQSSKVYVFSSNEDKEKVLKYQNGNRGFGDQASKVLIVTSDLSHFASVGERNQCWIDGGMFSMSLVYGLHSLGLGTCCLNWSVERGRDQRLREVAVIPQSEAIIMMIAVGHLPEELNVAQSPRKKLHEVMMVR